MKRLTFALLVAALCAGCGHKAEKIVTLDVAEFDAMLRQQAVPLIDVRTAEEYASGHLPGAINIDVKQATFANRASGLGDTVAVYCLRGTRSMKAAGQLAANGKVVYNMAGGIAAWQAAGLATTTSI